MRFEQLKRESNVILHKKLYKKGKNWIVSSTLIFAGAMILMNCNATTVNADTLTDSTETVVPSNNQTDQPTTSVTPNNVIADEPVNNALSSQSATVTKSTNDDLTTENTANNTPVETGSATQTNTADKQTNNYNFQNSSTNLVSSKNTSLPEVQASTNTSTQSTPEYTIANTARLKNFNYSVSGTTLFIKGIGDDTLIDTLAFRTNNEISNTLTADNIDTNSITKIDTSQGTPLNVHNSSNLFGNTSESNFNKYSAFPNVTDFDLSGMKLNPYNLPTSSKPPIQNTLLNTFGYSHLKTLDFTSANWDTSTFLNFNSMFTGTKDLAQINGLEFFDTANAIYMSNMFNGSGLTSLDISNFNMSKVTSKVNMLANMSNLTSIKLGNGDNIAGTGLSDIGPDYVWVNVKNPKDALSSADLMTRYNGTGNPDVDTFRKEPVNYKVADVTIQTSLGDKTVKNIFGSIGSTVSVAVPSEDGYTADKNTVDAFISDDGIAIVDPGGAGFVTYNPKTVVGDVIIHTSLGDKSAKTSGEVGSTIPVTVPNIDGYTPDKSTVDALVSANGIDVIDPNGVGFVTYTKNQPTSVTADVIIQSNLGEQTVNKTGNVGETIPVDVPNIDGYTPDKSTVDALVSANGIDVIDPNGVGFVTYTKNQPTSVTADVIIQSNLGEQTVNKTGNVGETIPVDVPNIDGYTPDKSTVNALVSANGIDVIDPNGVGFVTYTKNQPTSVTADVTIKTSLGDKAVKASGEVGTTINIPVPVVAGYTADKTSVKGNVTKDGISIVEPDTTGYVTYTKINNNNNNGGGNTVKPSGPSISNSEQYVSILPESNKTQLYSLDNDKMNFIPNTYLAEKTDWHSDQVATINNDTYYRVATNQWVKSNFAYLYIPTNGVVKISDHNQRLTNSAGKLVMIRELGADSLWLTDRIAYINNKPYYRVSTNEFVPTDAFNISFN